MLTNRRHTKYFYISLVILYLGTISVEAQQNKNQQNITSVCPFDHRLVPDGLKIGLIKVNARGGSSAIEKQLTNTFSKRDYSRDLVYQAMAKVEDFLSDEANQVFEKQMGIVGGATPQIKGGYLLLTTPCVEINDSSKTIDFIINILFLRTDLQNLANNILPIPRSLKPSFYNKMPAPLRVFNPQFNFNYDGKTGPETSLDISTNLLNLSNVSENRRPKVIDGKKHSARNQLRFTFSGRKSLTKQFYQTKTALIFSKIRSGKFIEEMDLIGGFSADEQPLNDMRYVNNGLRMGAQIKLRPHIGILNTINLFGGYSNDSNRVYQQARLDNLGGRDSKFNFRSIIDGRLWKGFARIGVWAESTKLDESLNRYRRIAGIFGYQKEFGSGTQTVCIEAIAGGGKTSGTVPLYARFFGGNNSSNYLYESPDSIVLTSFPVGPLLRSYGKTKAALSTPNGLTSGGKAFWHANFNLTIPIPSWSRRLIPDETIVNKDDDGNITSTIKVNAMLENFTVKSAIGGIGDNLLDSIIADLMKKNPNLDETEAEQLALPIAQREAEKIVNKDIAPTMKFISRHANLYAVKPLFMFDAAKLYGDGLFNSRYRYGFGSGLQIVMVVARAEIGYMFSAPRVIGEQKGNFVFRITFQNLY